VSIFFARPSLAALETRLRSRAPRAEAAIQRRLAAPEGMNRAGEFDFSSYHDDLEKAVADIHAILYDNSKG